jgi:signal transduction histidine kinase
LSYPSTLLGLQPPGTLPPDQHPGTQWLWRDRWLLGALLICALPIGYQLAVTLLRPIWVGPATDWLSAVLSLPELLVVVFVSLRLSQARWPGALSWWMWSAGILCHTIGQTIWTVQNQILFHQGLPSPNLPDLFFLLQYPFFFLAVLLIPHARPGRSRLIMTLDSLLFIGAATAFSWYFLLKPIYVASGMSPLTRWVVLAYPVGDLFVLFGLVVTLLRPIRYRADRQVLSILIAAVICLIIADSWAAWLEVEPLHYYPSGNPPDVLWTACYLLIPLAAVAQLRLAKRGPPQSDDQAASESSWSLRWRDFEASISFLYPFLAALLASAAIIIREVMTEMYDGWLHLIPAIAVSFGLLALMIVRQEVMFLETARLYHEREVARANEQAMRELNRRKDEFLGIVSHELKTPLASLRGYVELMARRFNAWRPREGEDEDLVRLLAMSRTALEYSEDSVRRITGLVDDLLDDARIREGNLTIHLEPCDLKSIVWKAVEGQRLLAPGRTIRLELPEAQPVLVNADAARIEQVITNYLTNALKYSKQDQPVAVRLEVEGDLARVSVRDDGIGVPVSERAHLWERFHRIEGIEVQSGSSIGLGIGLHISKSIIEQHHGQVGVQSAPGQGSVFWFTLPLIYSTP